jgi:hypothetical protein
VTTDEFLSQLWEFLAQWGPVSVAVGAAFFLIVVVLALTMIISVFRSFLREEREDRRFTRRVR